jgi:hypothetical protein
MFTSLSATVVVRSALFAAIVTAATVGYIYLVYLITRPSRSSPSEALDLGQSDKPPARGADEKPPGRSDQPTKEGTTMATGEKVDVTRTNPFAALFVVLSPALTWMVLVLGLEEVTVRWLSPLPTGISPGRSWFDVWGIGVVTGTIATAAAVGLIYFIYLIDRRAPK